VLLPAARRIELRASAAGRRLLPRGVSPNALCPQKTSHAHRAHRVHVIRICMYIYAYYMYMYITHRVYIHTHIHVHVYMHVPVCVHACIRRCTHVCGWYVCVSVRVCGSVCVYVCMKWDAEPLRATGRLRAAVGHSAGVPRTRTSSSMRLLMCRQRFPGVPPLV
jgi:hypothetical protein